MNIGELLRLIANLIKQGEIAAVDPDARKVQVRTGELITDWLDYFVPAAGEVSVHRPPSVGENCIILSPSGDTSCGLVLCGMDSSKYPSPGNTQPEHIIKYKDGAIVSYNWETGALKAIGVKTANVEAIEKIELTAPEIVLNASNSIDLQSPQTTASEKLTANGLLTFTAGMAGSGAGGGGGKAVAIDCPVQFKQSVTSDQIVQDGHRHNETGSITGGPVK